MAVTSYLKNRNQAHGIVPRNAVQRSDETFDGGSARS